MKQESKLRNVRIIINPSSGKQIPVLAILSDAMKEGGLEWEVAVSKEKGDALRLAKEAIANGVDIVAVYGGDGTLSEAAGAFIGSDVLLFILPGGSANVLATELGIPKDLKEALQLLCSDSLEVQSVDIARFNDCYSLVRAGLGFEAEMVHEADREIKKKLGVFAYFYSAAAAFKKTKHVRYQIKIDGEEHFVNGWTCVVTNAGSLGFANISLDKKIDVSDGLLDVLVVRKANLSFVNHVLATLIRRERRENFELVKHWQGKHIQVKTSQQQVVQCDGEALGKVPFDIRVIPGAIKVLRPKVVVESGEKTPKHVN